MNHTRILGLGLLLLLLSTTAVVGQTDSPVYKADGAFANLAACWSGGYNGWTTYCAYVSVFDGSTSTPLLVYDLNASAGGVFLFDSFGYGSIPEGAFQVQGRTDSLNIDTGALPEFVNVRCIPDWNTGVVTCGPGWGGVITATWIELTPPIGSSQSGTFKYYSPGGRFTMAGTSDYKSAAVSDVTVLGLPVTNVGGTVGKQHNTNITVYHP